MRVGLLPGAVSAAGGPSTYVSEVVRGLARVASDADVRTLLLGTRLATSAGRLERRRTADVLGSPVGSVLTRPVSPRLYSSRRIARLLPTYDRLFGKHDVYHQTHLDLDPPVQDHQLVLTVHDLIAEHWDDEGVLLPGAAQLLGRAAAIITVSRASRDMILARFPDVRPDRLHVAWNGVDHDRFHGRTGVDDVRHLRDAGVEGQFLLYVGGLSARKNLETLIQAYADARSRFTAFPQLVLIGPWDASRISKRVGEGVTACGSVPPEAVPSFMRRAEALVLPSREEGFGLPLLESQACGTPVICSDIPVFREIGGEGAVFVDSSSAAALSVGLAQAWLELQVQPQDRRRAGMQHAATFTWDRSAHVHARVYRAVAESTRLVQGTPDL